MDGGGHLTAVSNKWFCNISVPVGCVCVWERGRHFKSTYKGAKMLAKHDAVIAYYTDTGH